MKRISRRKIRKQGKIFFYALETMLLKTGFYSRYVRKDRALWVHERKGQPALFSVNENGQVITLREIRTDEDRSLDLVEKAAVNAMELAKALLNAKKLRVCYPNNLRERVMLLAEFGDHQLLCWKHRGMFTGYSYLVKQKEMPALYRNIFHDYAEAKEEFAKQANIVDGWMNFEVIKAIGCAVRYYRENAAEDRPYIMEALAKTEKTLDDLAYRGDNSLYAYAFDILDHNIWDKKGRGVKQAASCAD